MNLNLKQKVTVAIIIIAVLLSGTSITISGTVISKIIEKNSREKAESLAHTVSLIVDRDKVIMLKNSIDEIYSSAPEKVRSDKWGSDAFNSYISLFSEIEKSQLYKSLHNTLHYAQVSNGVESVYLLYIDPSLKNCIYILDASDSSIDQNSPGVIDALDSNEINNRLIDHPEIGFPPFVTKTKEYGWLVTAGVPLYTANGKPFAYAMVDVSMSGIRMQQRKFAFIIGLVLCVLTVIICVIAIMVVNRTVTQPISKISMAAFQYCHDNSDEERTGFSTLDIHTGDEIEELANSMKKMESDLNNHIRTILNTMHELTITRKKADEMSELAHKDALTGLRNKAAYDNEIKRLTAGIASGKTAFGIAMIDLNFLKMINDTYGHEQGNIALKKLSQIICKTFSHSPVFRIGGDEFVAILENSDYENAESLKYRFKDEINDLNKNISLSPWERVSAAIGIAFFDAEQDESAESVFVRADALMYEDKKKSKSERTV